VGEEEEKLNFLPGKIGLNLVHKFVKKLLFLPLLLDEFEGPLLPQFSGSPPHFQSSNNRKLISPVINKQAL